MNKMVEIVIRPARREDCEEICNLIQELADYEKMAHSPVVKADMLEKDGFGDNPLFHSIVVENNGKLVGFAIFYFTFDSWDGKAMYLEAMYVTEDFRKKGIGSLLFDAVTKRAIETNCNRLDLCVISWTPAGDFYKKKGAIDITATENWHQYRLDFDALKKISESN